LKTILLSVPDGDMARVSDRLTIIASCWQKQH